MTTLLSLALMLGTGLAAIPPSSDPFYTPPAGFESTAPGTILANRTFIPSFLGLVPDPVLGYQLLYRSTAINGSAIAEVTSIFVPSNASTDKFVSFATAYDSSATICNPSYNYQFLAAQTDLISSFEMLILQAFLLGNYIVASPDYEGPDAAFGPGRLAGMGVLDNMRAVSNFAETLGLATSTPEIVGVGYSGGAIATGWAASLASSYAPELNVKGWSMGGTPANLTGTALYLDNTAFSGFLPAAVAGLIQPSAYGASLQPVLESIITPYGQSLLDFAEQNCAVADLAVFFEQSILSTKVQTLGENIFYEPTIRAALEKNTMGVVASEHPSAPVYMYHAANDEIIPYANASALNAAWCADGASVNFITLENGGHLTTELLKVGDVYKFVQSAFAGTLGTGCTTSTELASNLNPIADLAALEPLLTDLLGLLKVTGTQDQNVKADPSVLNTTATTTAVSSA